MRRLEVTHSWNIDNDLLHFIGILVFEFNLSIWIQFILFKIPFFRIKFNIIWWEELPILFIPLVEYVIVYSSTNIVNREFMASIFEFPMWFSIIPLEFNKFLGNG